MREVWIKRTSDGVIVWHAYYQWPHVGVDLPYDVQVMVNEGLARMEVADVEPSRVSRVAAVPVRAFDRLLRKVFRL